MRHRQPTQNESADDYLAPRHAGGILGCTDDYVRALVRAGKLPAKRLPDGRMILRRGDVEALAERRRKAREERGQ